jgi:hypothetical protein
MNLAVSACQSPDVVNLNEEFEMRNKEYEIRNKK